MLILFNQFQKYGAAAKIFLLEFLTFVPNLFGCYKRFESGYTPEMQSNGNGYITYIYSYHCKYTDFLFVERS